MKIMLIASLLVLLVCPQVLCKTPKTEQDVQRHLLRTIAKKKITDSELEKAIGKLTLPARESPQYWIRIANDSRYSLFHRRYAAIELFKRHVSRGMKLDELARVLRHSTWLRDSDITPVYVVLGRVPVPMRESDSVYLIRILTTKQDDQWGIWVEATGEIEPQSFRDLILRSAKTKIGNETIVAVGYGYPGTR